MGIEPLSSVMTFQAQPVQQSQLQQEKVRGAEEGREALAQETSAKVDSTTAAVPKIDERSDEKNADGQSGQGNSELLQRNQDKIKKAVEQMNAKLYNSEAIFGIHDKTNRVMIKIVDKDSKEVIKELPPEKTLDMIAKIWEMAGILIDEKR